MSGARDLYLHVASGLAAIPVASSTSRVTRTLLEGC